MLSCLSSGKVSSSVPLATCLCSRPALFLSNNTRAVCLRWVAHVAHTVHGWCVGLCTLLAGRRHYLLKISRPPLRCLYPRGTARLVPSSKFSSFQRYWDLSRCRRSSEQAPMSVCFGMRAMRRMSCRGKQLRVDLCNWYDLILRIMSARLFSS